MEALTFPQFPSFSTIEKFSQLRDHTQSRHHVHCRNQVKVALKLEELSTNHHHVFDKMPTENTFAWNHLIQMHLANRELDRVMYVYQQMLLRGVCPDKHTLPRVLAASRLFNSLFLGKQVHCHAVKLGISSEDYVVTALMKMYGDLDSASTVKQIYDKSAIAKSSISATLLISMYLKENKPRLAIDLFYQMVSMNAQIDAVSVMTAIGACAMLKSLKEGRKVHNIAKVYGLESHILVCNSLLKMYLDCGSLKDARKVFDKMSSRDSISWTEMIRGYVKNGGFNEGLKLFKKMVLEGIRPDPPAISSILPACARMTAQKQGKEVHGYLIRNGIDINVTVHNALMDMYVKSGSVEFAELVFNQMISKDSISWTIMMHGYSLHGQGRKGVELFHEMKRNNLEIDQVTYASALHASMVASLVDEGNTIFGFIRRPEIRHYALMVLLLVRAKLFDEAKVFIDRNRIGHHAEVARALLHGCRIHQDVKAGKKLIEQLCDLEPLNADNYILLSNWYARNSKWDMVDKLRETIRDMGLLPSKAYSWIEFQNKIHVFGTGDVSHPRSQKLYSELQHLMEKMREEGHKFEADFSLHDVDEERECVTIGHSEMLAVSFGLISTKDTTIRVTKNLHICRNCHDMAKVISRLAARKMIIKDPNCFHHFKDGRCSCGDLW